MITPFLIAKSLPRWLWAVIGIALAGAVFLWWLDKREDAAVEADRARTSAEAAAKAREADESAYEASQGKSQTVEQSNAEAKKAADSGTDSLRDALDSLRATRSRPDR